jgi:penicillin-binding protein 1A
MRASCRRSSSRSGWSASIPRTRSSSSISTASISAPAPTASRPPRSAISASPRKNVTLAEAAMLAGLVKSPSRLAPNRNPEAPRSARRSCSPRWRTPNSSPRRRRRPRSQHPSAPIVKPAGAGTINYVADWIMDVLDDLVGRSTRTSWSRPRSIRSCRRRRAALIDELAAKGAKFNVSQGALVAMTPDGAVRALVGGELRREPVQPRGRGQAPAGLGVQAVRLSHRARARADARHGARGRADRRQGLEAGELQPRIFRPGDADAGAGDVAQHRRGAADARGRAEAVVRTAHRLGIASKLEPNASIALGTSEVSRDRAGRRLCAVRQWRHRVAPHVVTGCAPPTASCSIAPRRPARPVIDRAHVAMMNTMMQETLLSGTARKAALPGLAGRRQDRHQPGFPRRLVHRLHRPPRHRRLARQ